MSLSLLATYSSSDSEDCEAQPVYTHGKRKPPENDDKSSNKRLPPPQLPVLRECKAISRTPVVDSTTHQNRVRSFAHEAGNWATFIYIPIECTKKQTELMLEIKNELKQFKVELVDDFHVSLTKTVTLRHHWINSFVDSVRSQLLQDNKFLLKLYSLKVYTNDEKTRTFLGVQCQEGVESLEILVRKLDSCLSDYKLPLYYSDPSFHMSILWCLGDCSTEMETYICSLGLEQKFQNLQFFNEVNSCYCKCGNKSFNFPLV